MMNQEQLKSTATTVMNKVNTLGFTKNGKPMVIDQAYEVVAAQQGYRNQHALRSSLNSATESSSSTESDGEHLWQSTWITQGWNEDVKVLHLEGFLRSKGLMAEFAAYADRAATEENNESVSLLSDTDIDLSSEATYSFSIGALNRDALEAEAFRREVQFSKWNDSGDIRAALMTWYDIEMRRVADAAYEAFDFGELPVATANGWACNGAEFQRAVFLEQPGTDSLKVTFALRVVNLKAEDVHVLT